MFIRHHHHPPFQVTAEGSAPSVRTYVGRQAGRQASPTRSRSCLPGTDRRSRPGRRKNNSKSRTGYPLVTKRHKKDNPVLLLWSPLVRVVFTVRTDKLLIPFGGYFQRTFFAAANVTRAARKSKNGGGLKKKRGEKRGRRGDDVRESRGKTNNKTREKSCGAEVRRAGEPPLLSSPSEDTGGEVGVLAVKKLIQLDRTSQQRHVELERSGARRRRCRRPRRRRERVRDTERERERGRKKSPFLPLSVTPSVPLLCFPGTAQFRRLGWFNFSLSRQKSSSSSSSSLFLILLLLLFVEERRRDSTPGPEPRARTDGRGVPHRMDERTARCCCCCCFAAAASRDRATRSTPTRADSLPRRPVGRPQLP